MGALQEMGVGAPIFGGACRRLAALWLAVVVASASAPALADDACWSAAQLKFRPGEDRVVRESERALVDVPPGGARIWQSPYEWHGALRRVDLPPGKKLVALTFDLCEQPNEVAGYQGQIVDYLRANNIKATFFLGGKWILTHVTRAEQMMSNSLFEVGNHSWAHRNVRVIEGASALDDEIAKPLVAYRYVRNRLAERACVPSEGSAFRSIPDRMTLFRFPFGACNPAALVAVEARGMRAVQWDVSSNDPSKEETAHRMVRDVVGRVRPGSIVLFHANGRGWHTAQAIPMIVGELRAKGYSFVTVTELLHTPGARPVVSRICYDERPGDTNRYDSLARSLEIQHAKAVERIRAKSGLARRQRSTASPR